VLLECSRLSLQTLKIPLCDSKQLPIKGCTSYYKTTASQLVRFT
jgi:hypothetical protein